MALIKCPECKKRISERCESCPQCGYPIKNILQNESLNIEDNKIVEAVLEPKKPFYKKVWVWIFAGVVLTAFIFCAMLLLNGDTKPKLDKEGNPVYVELTNEVYTNAKKYKGYHINIKGKVFQVMSDNGNVKGIQIWLDPDTCEQNMMIYYNTDVEVKQGDYIACSGYIDSVTEYKNAYDAKLYAPLVISSDLKKSTYVDVMAPAIETITLENIKQEKYGYSVSINKIEFAEKETRVYMTVANKGKATLNFIDAIVVQNGKQYNSISNYDAEYEEIPYEIVKGVSCSGIMVFPNMSAKDFEITINIHSDNYDEDLEHFLFKITKVVFEQKPTDIIPTTAPVTVPTTILSNNTTISKNQQAVKSAEEIADFYATVFPAMVKEILIDDYGYTETQANYGVKNANIDWNRYAAIHLKEYVYINEWNVTKSDAERHLGADKGYSQNAIQYAFKNTDIDWTLHENSSITECELTLSHSNIDIQSEFIINAYVSYDDDDFPNGVSLTADYDNSIVEVEWGDWEEKTVSCKIIPIQKGSCSIKVYINEQPTKHKTITVNVD